MALAGELVLVRNQTRRSVEAQEPLSRTAAARLHSVTAEFQEAVLQTRMQPVANLFARFPRLVRDLARQLGKEIHLEVAGGDVELDKTILDALSDPLVHLVRNCCDHGLETPEDRELAGKSRSGTLMLSAVQQGDEITLTIADDGRGIDRQRVREHAQRQGIRTAAELDRLGDSDLLGLILLPGFSTATQAQRPFGTRRRHGRRPHEPAADRRPRGDRVDAGSGHDLSPAAAAHVGHHSGPAGLVRRPDAGGASEGLGTTRARAAGRFPRPARGDLGSTGVAAARQAAARGQPGRDLGTGPARVGSRSHRADALSPWSRPAAASSGWRSTPC